MAPKNLAQLRKQDAFYAELALFGFFAASPYFIFEMETVNDGYTYGIGIASLIGGLYPLLKRPIMAQLGATAAPTTSEIVNSLKAYQMELALLGFVLASPYLIYDVDSIGDAVMLGKGLGFILAGFVPHVRDHAWETVKSVASTASQRLGHSAKGNEAGETAPADKGFVPVR
ncbi:MAG: hypothetical protein K0U23_05450 [Gammaproteobacteria bacterium]|nr:hypothetical protein [Gammaproteobacteria bacterium]